MDKISVKDFIEKYNGDVDSLEIDTYLPIEDKAAIINAALENIFITEKKISATYNSITVKVTRDLVLLSAYTNLDSLTLSDYDLLKENDLIVPIFYSIGEDVKEFYAFFDLRFNDYLRDLNSIDGMVNRALGELTSVINGIDPKLIETLIKIIDKV